MTRDEIFEHVREVLEEALGADEDEITLDASLTEAPRPRLSPRSTNYESAELSVRPTTDKRSHE